MKNNPLKAHSKQRVRLEHSNQSYRNPSIVRDALNMLIQCLELNFKRAGKGSQPVARAAAESSVKT